MNPKQKVVRFSRWLLPVILIATSCTASRLKVGKIPLVNYFLTNPVFRQSHTGLMVYDPATGKTIYDYNSQKHFVPASNTKLLTYLAATKMLGDSIPSLDYCIANDSLFFTGTGDPTFLYENFNYGKTYNFLKPKPQALIYVEKPTADARFGAGWAWDDYPFHFSAERSSFPIYGNMATFQKKNGMDHTAVIPPFFEDWLTVKQHPDAEGYILERKEFENQFTLIFDGRTVEFESKIPFIYSKDLFVKLLSDSLKRPVAFRNNFPDCTTKIIYSVPSDSVYSRILRQSDNFISEQLLYVISSSMGDTLNAEKAIKYSLDHQLAEFCDEINWVDGSGLSRYNQLSPMVMIRVLNQLYHDVPLETLYKLLPEPGKEGSLEKSFLKLSGHMHAKTGSMRHVYNLSGFLETKSGRTLLFSFMNNNFTASFSELKSEMESVLHSFINDVK